MKENNKEQERFVAYITKQQCVNEAASVTDFLRKYAFRYHNSAFISSDPVQFPHRYHRKEDIEISGFLTAYLSFGARPQILKAAERLDAVMQHMPLVYVLSKDWKSDFCGEESFYRTVSKNKMGGIIPLVTWNIYKIWLYGSGFNGVSGGLSDTTPMSFVGRFGQGTAKSLICFFVG